MAQRQSTPDRLELPHRSLQAVPVRVVPIKPKSPVNPTRLLITNTCLGAASATEAPDAYNSGGEAVEQGGTSSASGSGSLESLGTSGGEPNAVPTDGLSSSGSSSSSFSSSSSSSSASSFSSSISESSSSSISTGSSGSYSGSSGPSQPGPSVAAPAPPPNPSDEILVPGSSHENEYPDETEGTVGQGTGPSAPVAPAPTSSRMEKYGPQGPSETLKHREGEEGGYAGSGSVPSGRFRCIENHSFLNKTTLS